MALALENLSPTPDPNLLVGLNTADDAGVYKVTDDLALVCTVDILAPVVPDARVFGMVAAANCISDVYAMGGEPKLALNVVGFPGKEQPAILGEILRGGQLKAREAGVTIAGGHTFDTDGVMFGMSVTGYIHPDRIVTNAGAKPDDVIVLTKPIGVGTMIQAMLLDQDQDLDLAPVIQAMQTLNRAASRAMVAVGADAATDVTGYGLVGHLVEMAEASGVGIELSAGALPVHAGALAVIARGILEPGIAMNMGSFADRARLDPAVPADMRRMVFGSETSGGLIVVMRRETVSEFTRRFGGPAPVIGRVVKDHPGIVEVGS